MWTLLQKIGIPKIVFIMEGRVWIGGKLTEPFKVSSSNPSWHPCCSYSPYILHHAHVSIPKFGEEIKYKLDGRLNTQKLKTTSDNNEAGWRPLCQWFCFYNNHSGILTRRCYSKKQLLKRQNWYMVCMLSYPPVTLMMLSWIVLKCSYNLATTYQAILATLSLKIQQCLMVQQHSMPCNSVGGTKEVLIYLPSWSSMRQ